ncbi:hypothetical protein [Shewanella frigidimarina]|uniref:hypothetical protein n=1 Tax=Shewanella frigidimarina TaxID=56812 RepID=UPI003D79EDF3
MKKSILVVLLLIANGVSAASAPTDSNQDNELQIRTLIQNLYTDGKNPNTSAETYLYKYFSPIDLKKLHVVSGPDGEQKAWTKMVQAFDVSEQRYQQYLDMLLTAEKAPITFYQDGARATIEIEVPRQPKFIKYQGKWYASM